MRVDRLKAQATTLFALTATGRIRCENDPDRSPGPLLYVAGCEEGNLAFVRHDVADEVAETASALVEEQAPWASGEPPFLGLLTALLARQAPIPSIEMSRIYNLPNAVAGPERRAFICSDTAEGRDLLDRFLREGLPEPLVSAGFETVEDLWWPWCVAFEGEAIAAIAFAARLAIHGAEIGVYSFPGFRGRGWAAAVTAQWASLPSLWDRALFYSMAETNISSQRVAERLGLERIGTSLRVT